MVSLSCQLCVEILEIPFTTLFETKHFLEAFSKKSYQNVLLNLDDDLRIFLQQPRLCYLLSREIFDCASDLGRTLGTI